jgi:hypothetical protein
VRPTGEVRVCDGSGLAGENGARWRRGAVEVRVRVGMTVVALTVEKRVDESGIGIRGGTAKVARRLEERVELMGVVDGGGWCMKVVLLLDDAGVTGERVRVRIRRTGGGIRSGRGGGAVRRSAAV